VTDDPYTRRETIWTQPPADRQAPEEPLFAERPVDEEPQYNPVRQRRGPLQAIGSAIVAAGLAVAKFGGLLLKLKFLGTGVTFFVSVAAYTLLWPWQFALGFTALILVHELGHVIQLRREGVHATAPLFIPFFGAMVGMRELPENAWVEAKVGLAGPVLGTLGGLATLALAISFDSDFLRALAYVAFLLNLFNLIPIIPLDGGRAAAAFHPVVWLIGLAGIAALFVVHESPVLILILLVGALELWSRWKGRNTPAAREYRRITTAQRIAVGVTYLALVAVLVGGMDLSYIHRDF
jgi:Zn-dependent protease